MDNAKFERRYWIHTVTPLHVGTGRWLHRPTDRAGEGHELALHPWLRREGRSSRPFWRHGEKKGG